MLSVVGELVWYTLGLIGVGSILQWKKQSIASSIILGMIATYLCWLITLDVTVAIPVLKIAAIWGAFVVFRSGQATAFWIILFFAGQLFLSSPIKVWDEIFVWAFHGKALHQMQGQDLLKALAHPELWLVHSEYPKLYATLAATLTHGREWGSFIPKFPMVLLILPSWLTIFHLPFSWKRRALLFIITLTFTGRLVLTAYMDTALSTTLLAGTLAVLTDSKQRREGWLLLSLLPLIKVEGALLAAIVVGVYFFEKWRQKILRQNLLQALWLLPSAVAVVLWKARCVQYGIHSYYTSDALSKVSTTTRFIDRATTPHSYWNIFSSMAETKTALFCILVLMVIYAWLGQKRFERNSRILFIVAGLYLAALTLVYLGTPLNLNDHLVSSVERTVLPMYYLAYAALFTSHVMPIDTEK